MTILKKKNKDESKILKKEEYHKRESYEF
jgi:hypothetical protein